MNALQKCWYRTFQVCFKAVSGLLPWRKPEILEGEGSIFKVGEIIKQKGLKKAMIVTGPNISKTNMLDNLYKGLSDNGIEYVVFNKTVQNPTIDVVENALAEYKANGCQCIVALGGGSSMDSAKAMGARFEGYASSAVVLRHSDNCRKRKRSYDRRGHFRSENSRKICYQRPQPHP